MKTTVDLRQFHPQLDGGLTLYLSRITAPLPIDHQLVMRGFPRGATCFPRAEFGVLYRVEPDGSAIIQSNVEPDWSTCLPANRVQTKEYNPERQIIEGASYRMRLAFNSVDRSPMISDPSRIHEVSADPTEWLSKRDIGGAIIIDHVSVTPQFSRSKNSLVPTNRAIVDGIITVTNKDKLLQCIRKGVGRNKAYGCGLLSLG